jgi:hypothetical protein
VIVFEDIRGNTRLDWTAHWVGHRLPLEQQLDRSHDLVAGVDTGHMPPSHTHSFLHPRYVEGVFQAK